MKSVGSSFHCSRINSPRVFYSHFHKISSLFFGGFASCNCDYTDWQTHKIDIKAWYSSLYFFNIGDNENVPVITLQGDCHSLSPVTGVPNGSSVTSFSSGLVRSWDGPIALVPQVWSPWSVVCSVMCRQFKLLDNWLTARWKNHVNPNLGCFYLKLKRSVTVFM